MARKKKGVSTDVEDLNLVPIMNLVVCLIPIILYGTVMVKIGVINVNAPKFGMGKATPPSDDEEKPLNLTLGIEETGFRLKATGADINQLLGMEPAAMAAPDADPSAMPVAGVLIPKKGDDYDFVELYNKLVVIKKAKPEESIINLTADKKIHYVHIIKSMDAIRYQLEQDSYSEMDAYKEAGIRKDANTRELLWPDVVFAVAQ
jgi:biopolymer transport protein ExbD